MKCKIKVNKIYILKGRNQNFIILLCTKYMNNDVFIYLGSKLLLLMYANRSNKVLNSGNEKLMRIAIENK